MEDKTIVIIPTFNEKDNIPSLIEQIFNLLPKIRILIVDDNSPDKTSEEVEKLQKKYPNLTLLRRLGREGLGRAYVDGCKKRLQNPEYKFIVMMDGDHSHNPKYLPEMLKLAETYDLVIGSRYTKGGEITKGWELWRRILSAGGNWYLRILFRSSIYDWTTGYNMISTDILRKVNLDNLNPKGYAFISSLKYYLLKSGGKAIELPIFFEDRNHGQSKMSTNIIAEGIIAPWKIILKDFFATKDT